MTLLVGSIFHMTRKIVSEMTYNVSMGTLNPTIPYHTEVEHTFVDMVVCSKTVVEDWYSADMWILFARYILLVDHFVHYDYQGKVHIHNVFLWFLFLTPLSAYKSFNTSFLDVFSIICYFTSFFCALHYSVDRNRAERWQFSLCLIQY